MSVDTSGFEDVSKLRKSKVWLNMLFNKEKGLALCKICLQIQFTRIYFYPSEPFTLACFDM